MLDKCVFKLLWDSPSMNFFPTSRLTQEREKLSTNELPTTRFAIEFFLSYKLLKSRKRRIFLPTSYIQGQLKYRKPRKPLSPPGLVCRHKRGMWERKEKKRQRPRKVVCRHKKGTWGKPEKEKKRKRPRKARRWLLRKQGSVCPTPRIPFFGSQVFGLRSGPSRLKYRLLRDLVYKEAMCERSSGNGLLYKAKAVP